MAGLEKKIRDGQVTVPLAVTKPDIQRWRNELGRRPGALSVAASRIPQR